MRENGGKEEREWERGVASMQCGCDGLEEREGWTTTDALFGSDGVNQSRFRIEIEGIPEIYTSSSWAMSSGKVRNEPFHINSLSISLLQFAAFKKREWKGLRTGLKGFVKRRKKSPHDVNDSIECKWKLNSEHRTTLSNHLFVFQVKCSQDGLEWKYNNNNGERERERVKICRCDATDGMKQRKGKQQREEEKRRNKPTSKVPALRGYTEREDEEKEAFCHLALAQSRSWKRRTSPFSLRLKRKRKRKREI